MAKVLIKQQEHQLNLLINFITNSTSKRGAAALTVNHCRSRLDLLEKYWDKFFRGHDALFEVEEDISKTPYVQENKFVDGESAYIDAKVHLTEELRKLLPPDESEHQAPTQIMTPQTVTIRNIEHNPVSKMPVPKFSGLQEDWDAFKSLFTSIVKNNKHMTPVEKLQRLITSVDGGKAEKRIKNIALTDSNFDIAWTKLTRRYDNPKVRLMMHYEKLIDAKPMNCRSSDELNRILDIADEAIQGFKDLDCPVEHWDNIFVCSVARKLDPETREDWQISQENTVGFPTYSTLSSFLEQRVQSLEQAHGKGSSSGHKPDKSFSNSKGSNNTSSKFKSTQVHATQAADGGAGKKSRKSRPPPCSLCSGQHFINYCPEFINLTPHKRKDRVMELNLCRNCLRKGHYADECESKFKCYVCSQDHHTKLHLEAPSSGTHVVETSAVSEDNNTSVSLEDSSSCNTILAGRSVLLATAQIILKAPNGNAVSVRALIDPGAETSIIAEWVANVLSLERKKEQISVTGVGGEVMLTSSNSVSLILCSKFEEKFHLPFMALVLKKLINKTPKRDVVSQNWSHLDGLKLADPFFWKPRDVDCILGADLYDEIICRGFKKGPPGSPVAQQTHLGWILTGGSSTKAQSSEHKSTSAYHIAIAPDLNQLVRKFWEIEEIPATPVRSQDDEYCENYFSKTVFRQLDGRYGVRLPFSKVSTFPDSRSIAVSCLLRSERRRQREPELNHAYVRFMEEYIRLGHMVPIPEDETRQDHVFYLPHHPVFKSDGSKKIRVVFNASQRCSNGLTLNDCLLPGPKLQITIVIIITLWRMYPVVFTADIVKFFRQFLMHVNDADWQRIVWRSKPNEPIRDYRLITVTYGTVPAPFLAIRALQQLAHDEQKSFPAAAEVVLTQTYVDDTYAGADTEDEVIQLRDQLINLLKSAGIELDKWSANRESVLQGISKVEGNEISIDLSESISTLGLKWTPNLDCFSFKVSLPPTTLEITKRSILSEVARLFDPLGWLAPVVIKAKIILQDLWIMRCDWDSPITGEIVDRWIILRNQLPLLTDIQIPRWFGLYSNSSWQVHAFSDASDRAYAACIYLTIEGKSSLVMAKSKVAPVKTISIPKLELSGALLLSRLLHQFLSEFKRTPETVNCWTDSTVVLAWLRGHPSRWKPFVANRVTEILTTHPNASWRHVSSQDNPADCASRGLSPDQLKEFELWWHGPGWILDSESWPATREISMEDEQVTTEQRSSAILATIASDAPDLDVLKYVEKFSSLSKIIRIVAYCLRWRFNVSSNLSQPNYGPLTAKELIAGRLALFKAVQWQFFKPEMLKLRSGHRISKLNPIGRLLPFLCKQDLLRVGGRLHNSFLPYEEKHPIILPKNSFVTKLLVFEAHHITLHGGPQLMLSHLNRSVWILHGRRVVQSVTRNCVKCLRFVAKTTEQQMAPLPRVRLTPQRPFSITGVDYAGPILVRASKGRGITSHKGYIAIFVCMVVKAIHIEIVSDLTTAAFLAAYRRFTARRGNCTEMHSDNGTNFQGASIELANLFKETSSMSDEIAAIIAKDGTEWKFIPPRAPHFGGLWEAGVKSFKHHFKRVVRESTLTYEKLSTLAAQIEACLNSRPLCPVSSSSEDDLALTPGHFLIGGPIIAPPQPFDDVDLDKSYHSRWTLLLRMRNHFWARWRKEVLHQYQQRNKWLNPGDELRVDDVVLVKDELTPPTKWPLARITAIHPGSDQATRVVTLKTGTSSFKRAAVKVIRLHGEAPATPSTSDNERDQHLSQDSSRRAEPEDPNH